MHRLAPTADAIGATTKKTEKVALLADYLAAQPVETAAVAAVFFSGRPFPEYEETTLQVGGSTLWRLLADVSGKNASAMEKTYRRHGDLGDVAQEVLRSISPKKTTLSVIAVEQAFRAIAAAAGPAAKTSLLRSLLERATALEAKYIVKIVTGDLRIGLKQSLVEEAIAKAFGTKPADVQRANMLLGDIGETLRLAAARRLADARMRLFHPLGFMLASPAETAAGAFAYFEHAAVEDKYDGIRAQAHVSRAGTVKLFSRTRDEVTGSFPELSAPLAAFAADLILDGEIVAWRSSNHEPGRALPFADLQKRLGRKKVSESLMRDVPVAYVAFDVLYRGAELVIERPLRERARLLDQIFAAARKPALIATREPQGRLAFEPAITDASPPAQIIRAPVTRAESPAELETIFEAALARGNEGLMVKDLDSAYAPGRRGRSWLKLKRELATLDVVVTAVEFGHGKRAPVLSDYTFAVRDGDRLRNVGKAYSGLTDKEIVELTQWFLDHTLMDDGWRRVVEPKIVLEVAFNAVMQSSRHDSGFTLRFPRIVRLRPDKSPAEIDTLDRVRELFERQKLFYPAAT